MIFKFETHEISKDCMVALLKGLIGIACDAGMYQEVKREFEKFGFKCEIIP